MNNPNNQQPNQPAPLPPPQQQYHYPQNTNYQFSNPYYYPYYNTYPPQQLNNASAQAVPLPLPPPPPPPNPYYNPYYQTYPPPQPPLPPQPPPTWNRNPNNPPPPPPKPLISPNHNHNQSQPILLQSKVEYENKQMVWNNKNNKTNSTHPQSLQMYIEKCWNRFKSLAQHIASPQNKEKLQKQLKGRVQQTKANKTLFTIDWKNEPYPPHLRYLIEIETKSNSNSNSNSISPKKRKAQSGWNNNTMSRKVAKTSIRHREVHQMDNKTKTFLEMHNNNNNNNIKSDSDMSCSESESSMAINMSVRNNKNINFQIQRNNKMNNKMKFKNPFNISSSSSDEQHEQHESESEKSDESQEMFIISKGRGFHVHKMRKKKTRHKKNKKVKKTKNNKAFSWDTMDGIEALNTNNRNNRNNRNNEDDDNHEINRILERKKRFESKQKEKQKEIKKSNVNVNNNNNNHLKLSADMRRIMEWHNKRVIGSNTKIEKDYFRLTCEPNASEVRTLSTMKKAFSLLMIRWKRKNKRDYLYVGEQFKSLRQDLRVQHIRNEFSIRVYEENAKICLEVNDLSEYNQCQGQLKELYNEQQLPPANYIEFLCYRLLYEAVTKNFNAVSNIIRIEKQHCKHAEIVNTLNIIRAIQRTDYYTFFKMYKLLRYHAQLLLDQIIYKIRYLALCRITLSYCGGPATYPIQKLVNTIGFNRNSQGKKECIEYLKNTGCVFNNVSINCKASRGKIKEFIPKSVDDELGVTHGSVYHTKNAHENTSIAKFLRKT